MSTSLNMVAVRQKEKGSLRDPDVLRRLQYMQNAASLAFVSGMRAANKKINKY